MAEARHGIRITEPLNKIMRKVFDSGRGLSDSGLATLDDAVRAIDNVVSHINESTAFFSEQPLLLARLHEIETELDAVIAKEAIDTSASAVVPALAVVPDAAASPEAAEAIEAAALPEAGATAALEATMASEATAALEVTMASEATAAPEEVAAMPEAAATATVVLPEAAAAARATDAAVPGEHPPAEEFDHKIANIYSEEATELLEAAEVSLTAWNRDRKDKERVAELQRQLHTLKGGARMAAISAMADLSHDLETLVLQIDGGSVPADDHAHAVMQASLDELSRMRDLVSNGALPGGATALIAQIRELATAARTPAVVARHAPAAAPAVTPPVAAVTPPAAPIPASAPPSETSASIDAEELAAPARSVSLEPAPAAASEDSAANLELTSAPVLPGREAA